MSLEFYPSIWLNDFHSEAEWDEYSNYYKEASYVYDWIDDHLLLSRHPFSYIAYCEACESITHMTFDWRFAGGSNSLSINPAWTETYVCDNCGLNSRMRALISYLKSHSDYKNLNNVYIAEQITKSFQVLKNTLYPSLIGSEFLGTNYTSGDLVKNKIPGHQIIRHEDLTNLSFKNNSFDLVITQDVFEHIPDYFKAFTEINRILSEHGRLVFTIPFNANLEYTKIRASIINNQLIYYLPPEIHGDPLLTEGSLCYQNFGWDILSSLIEAGFSETRASLYWGPWKGHMGYPLFVFSADKNKHSK